MSETNPVETDPVETAPGRERTPGAGATLPGEIDVVRRDLASAVLADRGVLRLEPTLATMVRAWSTTPSPEDLVRVTTAGKTVDVALHLAVRGEEARLVAHRVRAAVRMVLADHGHVPGSVEVSVLTVEGADAAAAVV